MSRPESVVHDAQQFSDRMVAFDRVPQGLIGVDVVPIATPDALSDEEPSLLQLMQDALCRPLP